jgi:propanol-preferring alcohol dehydrogenase
MPAYRLVEWERPARLVEAPIPSPGPGEVRIRVAANGLCHSDIGMMQIPGAFVEPIGWKIPFTLGHEVAGWVDQLGPGVSGVAEGDAVALVSPSSCGVCRYCVRGLEGACLRGGAGRGFGRDGGLAPFVVARAERDLIPLGDLDPLSAGPLTDAGATAYHAVRRVLPRLVPGSTAVVLGAGGLGTFAVQFLRVLSPARVIAVDQSPARRAVALDFGAHHVVQGVDDDTAAALAELTEGFGAEAVLDFVGIDASINAGLRSVGVAGAFGLIGAAGGSFHGPWYGGFPKEADVFNFQSSGLRDVREVFVLAQQGLIRSEVDVFPLSAVEEGYAAMEAGTLRGRAVITP